MSMLDAFLNKGFKGAKCKTLLKLTIPRIKLLRNRREIQLKQMRRDIAKLLENGQEATARIRVEHIMREENMMAAQEIIELFCELIAVRLPIIETQRECPLDLKEAISSICFAAPRCSDLPELQQIQMLFAAKYGREFVAAAAELMPDCGVNRQIIELLSVRAPSVEAKLKLLKEIAEEHELDWDPAEAEAELHKPHEDLLNGPNHLLGGSTLPLPKEKHDDSSSSNLVEDSYEECGFIADSDSLDLPQVPKISVQPSPNTPSIPEITSPQLPSHPVDSSLVHVDSKSTPLVQDLHVPSSEHDGDSPKPSHSATSYAPPNVLTDTRENKQFIPFVSSPSLPPTSYSLNQEEPASFSCSSVSQNQSKPSPSVSCAKSGANVDLQDVLAAAQAAAETNQSKPSPSVSRAKSGANVDLQDVLAATETNQSKPSPSESCARSEVNVDLQDVLDAAQAAAETAERAAAAARAAASLAKVRITELTAKKNNQTSESTEKEFHENGVNQSKVLEGPIEQENASSHAGHGLAKEHSGGLDSPMLSPDSKQQGPVHQPTHQTQRSTSLEDDPYFSYPNLFTSQVSSPKAS